MEEKNCELSFSDRLLLIFTIADFLFDLPLIRKFVSKKLKKRIAELEAEAKAEEEKREKEAKLFHFKCRTEAEAAFDRHYKWLLSQNKDKLLKELEKAEKELKELKDNNPDLNKRLNEIANAIKEG